MQKHRKYNGASEMKRERERERERELEKREKELFQFSLSENYFCWEFVVAD